MHLKFYPIKMIFILVSFFLILPSTSFSRVVINEIMASNTSTYQDEAGDFDDWIELYNNSANDMDISGWHLSDDVSNRTKWSFPAQTHIQPGHFLIVWCDAEKDEGPFHTTFKLSKSGEWLGLTRPDLTVEDSLTFGEQISNYSYGRTPDGAGDFIIMNVPTPGSANPDDVLGIADSPDISPGSGLYTGKQRIELSSAYPNALIIYTRDGSAPDVSDIGAGAFEYTQPIVLDTTAVIRARVYAENYLPSETVTAACFINSPHRLPIMSFVTDPVNLFDDETGIYANWEHSGREWERPVFVSYFDENQLEFNISAGIRVQGNSSRTREKKSFRLFFRGSYGAPQLEYPLFDLTHIDVFDNLVTRAGYDDDVQMETGTLLRDPFCSEMYRRLGYPISHSKMGVLYLNNDFWGIYDFRESVNETFIKDYYGYTDMDVIRMRYGSWELDYGTSVEWENFLDFVRNNSFESDDMYKQLADQLDIENFTTILVHSHATQYRSWTYGSFFIRERRPAAKWEITIWDMDRAMTQMSWNGFSHYKEPEGQYWIHIITKRLMENAGYRRYFVNRLCDLLNTRFLPEHAIPVLDSLAAHIEYEIPREVAMWDTSVAKWYKNIDRLRWFVDTRPQAVRTNLQGYFNFNEPVAVHLSSDGRQGSINLNTIAVKSFPWSGLYYPENEIHVRAVPQPGYMFVGWSDSSLPQSADITINPTSDLFFEPQFLPLKDNIVINEIMYAHTDDRPCGDWVEIYNPGAEPVDLSNWLLKDNDDNHVFTFTNIKLPAADYLVISENVEAFSTFYPDVKNVIGSTSFGWNEKDEIRLYAAGGEPMDRVAYTSQSPWDSTPAKGSASLALLDPTLDNGLAKNWKANQDFGSPGQENFPDTTVESNSSRIPKIFKLSQNYPNPFNGSTWITFQLPYETHVKITVYDLRGRLVETLIDNDFTAGLHSVPWGADGHASGLYFYQMVAGDFKQTKRLVLQK